MSLFLEQKEKQCFFLMAILYMLLTLPSILDENPPDKCSLYWSHFWMWTKQLCSESRIKCQCEQQCICRTLLWDRPVLTTFLTSSTSNTITQEASLLLATHFRGEVSFPWITFCSRRVLKCVSPPSSSMNDGSDREDTCPELPLTGRKKKKKGWGRCTAWWVKYTTRQQTCRDYHL